MALNKHKVAYFCFLGVIIVAGHGMAKVLSPPVESAGKLVSEGYYERNLINKFNIVGEWREETHERKSVLVGKATKFPISIKSIDYLAKGPKSFIFNFSVANPQKIYGFIYGKMGLIIKDGNLFKAKFNEDYTKFDYLENIKREPYYSDDFLRNTIEFSTGYDPLGGTNIQCVIYINGIGEVFECPEKDDHFGVYLAPENEITIGGFKWDIANH